MKTKRYKKFQWVAVLAVLGLLSLPIASAAFNSGSDGSYGAINVPNNQVLTLQVPSNGVFHCTTITIGCNAGLTFTPNALNTPVYLLATGDVTINGVIFANGTNGSGSLGGAGGPGGFAGGMGGISGGHNIGGDGAGPGGGRNTVNAYGGAYAYNTRIVPGNSNTYGNALLYPLIGGSGGAGVNGTSGGYGGGGGGGAILVASTTKILFPNVCGYSSPYVGIYANGGNGASSAAGGGSGGAIRLVAPVVGGDSRATLYTNPGQLNYNNGWEGSLGRIRIDCTDDYSYRTLNYIGSFSRGSQMFVFQPNAVQLDITSAAGQSIPVGTTNSVTVSLPFGSPTNQAVTLQASNLTSNQPVRIAVVPDTGPSAFFDIIVTNTGNPSFSSNIVTIPAGTVSKINAWTR